MTKSKFLCKKLGFHSFKFNGSDEIKKDGYVEIRDTYVCSRCGMVKHNVSHIVSTKVVTSREVNKTLEEIKNNQ